MGDADFLMPIKNVIASRAGYRCSYPGCNCLTIGPSDDVEDFESTGMACHIFASSGGGPRGTGGLSVDERRKAYNGIWCCYKHGKLIDTNSGAEYPPELLQQWKTAHEARISHEHRAIPVPFGWLSQIEIPSSPLFSPGTAIQLGKVNLLVGANGTGKTALCEWVTAAGGDLKQIWRWKEKPSESPEWNIRLDYACPNPHLFQGSTNGGEINFSIDDVPAADINHGLRFVYMKDGLETSDSFDHVDLFAKRCGVHRDRILQAVRHLGKLKVPYLNSISVVDYDPAEHEELSEHEQSKLKATLESFGLRSCQRIQASIGSHDRELPFGRLSGREQSISLVSVGIAIADLISAHAPTVLLIDLGSQFLPQGLLNAYTNAFTQEKFRFQTILVSPDVDPKVDWTGWTIARFNGKAPSVEITQSMVSTPEDNRTVTI